MTRNRPLERRTQPPATVPLALNVDEVLHSKLGGLAERLHVDVEQAALVAIVRGIALHQRDRRVLEFGADDGLHAADPSAPSRVRL